MVEMIESINQQLADAMKDDEKNDKVFHREV